MRLLTTLALSTLLVACNRDTTDEDSAVPDDTGLPTDSESDSESESETESETESDSEETAAPADRDGDGVPDEDDAFPDDASESKDTDGDGVGDNADAFPDDASESKDTDSDGVGDNADAFPTDPAESKDTDGDGVGDNADAFPTDPAEHTDADADGVGSNADCDDDDPRRTPGKAEVWYDGVDNDCLGGSDYDQDADGDDAIAHGGTDCVDTDASVQGCGTGPASALETCKALRDADPTLADGVYWIDPDGLDAGEAAFQTRCDMTTDGGGWTLALLINSVKNGNYQDFGAANVNLADLQTEPEAASRSASGTPGVGGWLNINTFPYEALRMAGYGAGQRTFLSEDIDPTELRIDFGENGYYLYNDSNGYYWCGGEASYTDAGVGQVNPPAGAPADCKGHGSVGDGWDFSLANTTNQGLTTCGGGSRVMHSAWASPWTYYPNPGAAQAIWLR